MSKRLTDYAKLSDGWHPRRAHFPVQFTEATLNILSGKEESNNVARMPSIIPGNSSWYVNIISSSN